MHAFAGLRKPWRTKFIFGNPVSPENTGQARIWRSSYQGQGHLVTGAKRSLKSLFPQCKTSIGNPIKHRAMTFMCSMGFSVMADWMVWPPSLSGDRKWPRVTMRAFAGGVGLNLQSNLVFVLFVCPWVCPRAPRGMGEGALAPSSPMEMLQSAFLCCKCCLKSQYTKYLCIILRKCRQLLPLDSAGGLPSFRPSHCPALEKILRAPVSLSA